MHKRLGIIPVCVLVAAGVLALLRGREPSYEGKSLSDWIIRMHVGKEQAKARAVVHRLGTNSIPMLLEWLQKPDRPSPMEKVRLAKRGVISWLERNRWMTPRIWSQEMDWKGSYASLARAAFLELGSEGREAIPTLIQWLGRRAGTTNEFDRVAGEAYVILGKMGPASISPLIEALSSQDEQVYALAAGALGEIGPGASAAIPVLRRTLKDKAPTIRAGDADVIGRLGGDPDEVVTVLVESLREPDLENLDYKLGVLLRYKKEAKRAVPVLLELQRRTHDPGKPANEMVRYELKQAVRGIALETLRESRRNGRK